MLRAEGSYILPTNVPANEFLNLEGRKLSTSKNWAVWLPDYLVDFPDQQDVLRYVLTATAPETKDNDFTWKDFQSRNNNELVAIFGNFVNRVLVLTHKYYDGTVPKCDIVTSEDIEVLSSVKSYFKNIEYSLERFRFREASQQLMNIARIGNKYLAEQEPWKLIKSDSNRVRTIMNTALQIVTALSVISEPFLPFSANKLQLILNLKNKLSWVDLLSLKEYLEDGHIINETSLLFSKIEDSQIEKQLLKLRNKVNDVSSNQELVLEKEHIPFEDFSKMDLRVGKILEASKIKKTNKLLLLKVDLGSRI
jgi:methionyl-tRNA synthetase